MLLWSTAIRNTVEERLNFIFMRFFMKQLRKISIMMLLVSSIFMTGCDATKVAEVIGKISQAVEKAMPAIKSIAGAFEGLCQNSCQTSCSNSCSTSACQNSSCAGSSCQTASCVQDASVSVISPDKE